MAKIVEITHSSDIITCDNNGKSTLQFNVTNITSSSLRIGIEIICDEPAQKSWFTLEGKSEKQLDSNATDQFSVQVAAEQSLSEVTGKVRILVYSVENSDEDYTESEPITVKVPPQTVENNDTEPNNKWIIWILVGLVVFSLLGVIGYLIYDKMNATDPKPGFSERVPNVTGQLFEQAKIKLEELEFSNITSETRFDASVAQNTVLEQSPEAGTKEEDPSNTEIVLVLADSITTMLDVKDRTFQGAKERLNKAGFKKIKKESRFFIKKPPGTVLDQSPQPDTSVSVQDEITLIVADAGVTVPNVRNKSLANALKILQRAKLSLGNVTTRARAKQKTEVVASQNPAAGRKVEEKTEINLVVLTQKTNIAVFRPMILKTISLSGIKFNKTIKRELAPAEE